MMVSHAMPSEGSNVMHIQQRFSAVSYMDKDFSGFPQSIHSIMYDRW